jgi:hypothetical protein
MTDDNTSTNRITIRLPKFDFVYFLALEIHYLAIIGFSVFGLLISGTSFLTGTAEDIYRFWLALLGAVLAYFFSREKVLIPILILLAAIQHWLIPLVLGVFGSEETRDWRELSALGSGTALPTGYQSTMFIADLALIFAIVALAVSKPDESLRILKSVARAPKKFSTWLATPLSSVKPGQLFLGIGLAVQVFYVLLLFAIGITTQLFYFDSRSMEEKVALGFGVILAISLAVARWDRGKLIALGIATTVWNILVFPIIVNALAVQGLPRGWSFLLNRALDARLSDLGSVLDVSNTINGLAQFVVVAALVLIGIFAIVGRYSAAVGRWFDARHLEVYGSRPPTIGTESPREVSVMAVLSLIFAFVSPIIGLILAYSARNTIVHSQGRKTGLELTIAAAIISWFFILAIVGLVFLSALAPLLGIPNALDLFWELIFSALEN